MTSIIQTELDPALVRRDGPTQIRVELSPATIQFYELMIENADLQWPFKDPLVVFHDGQVYWLADGFQRDIAWQNVFTRNPIGTPPAYPVELHTGTLRDAIYYSTHEANHHGKPFNAKDRRNHAKRLVEDPEWTLYSNREIARIAGVDEKTVRTIRKEVAAMTSTATAPEWGEAAAAVTQGATTAKGETASSDLTARVAGLAPADTGVTLKAATLAATAPAVAGSAEFPHPDQQAVLFDLAAVSPAPLLPPIYAPVGEHVIIRLATPLDCVMLDTQDLSLCRQPATLAYAWLAEDEKTGALWSLRPVCAKCAKVASA